MRQDSGFAGASRRGVAGVGVPVGAWNHGGWAESGWQHFLGSFGPQAVLLVVVAVAGVLVAWTLRRTPPGRFGVHRPTAALAVFSAAAIGVATLTRRGDAWRPGDVQLHPFATIRGYLHDGDTATSVTVYVLGNVALFVPLAFFLYLAVRRSVLLTTVVAAGVSLAVEVLQLGIWSRSTDVDDLITNSVGGLAGALLAAAVYRLPRGWWTPRTLVPPRPGGGRRRSPTQAQPSTTR